MNATDLKENGIEAAAAAAFHHPNPEIRKRLEQKVRAALGITGTSEREVRIQCLLSKEEGAWPDEFLLSRPNLALSVLLAEAWFRSGDTERILVVSEDALGDGGGVVLTAAGNGFFVTCKRHEGSFLSYPKFYPGYLKRGVHTPEPGEGSIRLNENALSINVSWPLMGDIPAVPKNASVSILSITETPVRKLGLHLYQRDNSFVVEARKEESIIRLLAACQQGATLVIRSFQEKVSTRGAVPVSVPSELRLQLPYPDDHKILRPVFLAAADACSWMNFSLPATISLDAAEQSAIADWFAPHPTWSAAATPDGFAS